MRTVVACLISISLLAQDVVFRSDVQLLRVDVQVSDPAGKIVTGLKAEDFEILDDGVPQPIAAFEKDLNELDLMLVLDVSDSMSSITAEVKRQAANALRSLFFRDRVAVTIFDNQPYMVIEPTWDWDAVNRAIQDINVKGAGTEFNQSIGLIARVIQKFARPNARRALLVFSDNVGSRVVPESFTRDALWEADAIVVLAQFQPATDFKPKNRSDLQKFVEATGGETIPVIPGAFDLAGTLKRIREGYTIFYRPPAHKPGEVVKIRVRLRNPEHKNLVVRARSGYRMGIPGSDGRHKLTLR
jgi:Ca-activated chloride channel homolog